MDKGTKLSAQEIEQSELEQDAKTWWSEQSEKFKWNISINFINHWENLTTKEIVDLYTQEEL
jgi:hypothetical protein